jgi:hypothetical protein
MYQPWAVIILVRKSPTLSNATIHRVFVCGVLLSIKINVEEEERGREGAKRKERKIFH